MSQGPHQARDELFDTARVKHLTKQMIYGQTQYTPTQAQQMQQTHGRKPFLVNDSKVNKKPIQIQRPQTFQKVPIQQFVLTSPNAHQAAQQ